MSLPIDFDLTDKPARHLDVQRILGQNAPSIFEDVKNIPSSIFKITQEPDIEQIELEADSLGQYLLPGTLLAPSSQPIREAAAHLSLVLTQPDSEAATVYSKPVAAVISNALVYQISLPLRRKNGTREMTSHLPTTQAEFITGELQADLRIKFDTNGDDSSFKTLAQSTDAYQNLVMARLDSAQLKSAKPDILQGTLTDFDPLAQIFTSHLYVDFNDYLSPVFKKWERRFDYKLILEAAENPSTHSLLEDGALEHLGRVQRGLLWNFLPLASDSHSAPQEDPILKSAAQYFFNHSDIASYFWHQVSKSDRKLKLAPNTSEGKGVLDSLTEDTRLIEWALLQEGATFESFLATLKTEELFKAEQSQIKGLGRLWLTAAGLKTRYTNNENLDLFIAKLDKDSQVYAPGIFDQTSLVVKEQAPGIIYSDLKGATKVAVPGKDQEPEELFNQLKRLGAQSAFISGADSGWSQPTKQEGKSNTEAEDKEQPRLLIPSTEYILPGIGKLHETHPGYAMAVLETLEASVKYPNAYSGELDELSSRPKNSTRATHVLFPGLLPKEHPVRALETAGVVAVAQIGAFIEVIIHSEKAWFKPQGNLALQGEISNRRLIMDGARDQSSYPRIRNLVEAGLGYLTQPDLSKDLSKDEISEVRRMIKGWKAHAKTYGLPQDLSRVDNPMYRDPNSVYTLVQIGNKHDLLKIG